MPDATVSPRPRKFAQVAILCGLVACGAPVPPPAPVPDPAVQALEAIGYLDGYERADASTGVTTFDPARAAPGRLLVTSGRTPAAWLMEQDGTVLHRWSLPFEQAFPTQGSELVAEEGGKRWTDWRRVLLLPDGGLIAIHEGYGLVSLDVDSRLRWAVPNKAHHDLTLAPDGRLWVLTRAAHVVPRLRAEPVLEDFVTTVDLATGRELSRFSVLEAFEGTAFAAMLDKLPAGGDIFHTNALAVLDGTGSAAAPFLAKGNLLVSVRNTHTIAVIDGRTHKVIWAQTGPWRSQHDPSVLPDGQLLVFDNRGDAGRSRLLTWDPVAGATTWSYTGTRARPFKSGLLGTAQRLPNGDTLATESERGHAFELAPDGTIVWEYWNPERSERDPALRATLLEVEHLPATTPLTWLRTP